MQHQPPKKPTLFSTDQMAQRAEEVIAKKEHTEESLTKSIRQLEKIIAEQEPKVKVLIQQMQELKNYKYTLLTKNDDKVSKNTDDPNYNRRMNAELISKIVRELPPLKDDKDSKSRNSPEALKKIGELTSLRERIVQDTVDLQNHVHFSKESSSVGLDESIKRASYLLEEIPNNLEKYKKLHAELADIYRKEYKSLLLTLHQLDERKAAFERELVSLQKESKKFTG